MKKIRFLVIGIMIFISLSCLKEIDIDPDNFSDETGRVVFWVSTDFGWGYIDVTINGITKQINSYVSSTPSCDASGFASFNLEPGIYAFTASCSGKTWNGSVTITSGGCSKMQLKVGGNESGIGSGTTTGQVIFFTVNNYNCGNINVNIDGITKQISSISPGGTPACGTSGYATYTLSPGTYNYTATCSSTRKWNGSFVIGTKGGCLNVPL